MMNSYEEQFTKPRHHFVGIVVLFLSVTLLTTILYYAVLKPDSTDSNVNNENTNTAQSIDLNAISSTYANDSTKAVNVQPIQLGTYDVDSKDAASWGSKNARVTIVEFADFQCPFCEDAFSTVKRLQLTFGDSIYFQFRNFPLVDAHPQALHAANAAACAQAQGMEKFWAYHDRLYQFQSTLADTSYEAIAQSIGLDLSLFKACYAAQTYEERINQDYQDGVSAGIVGTPTFFINGKKVSGVIPEDVFVKVVQQLLKQ